MATAYGDNFTKAHVTSPPTIQNAYAWGGRVRVQQDVYEAAALEAASTIKIAKLPKGSMWLGISKLHWDALGASSTVSVGVSGTVAKFKAATDTSSAGSGACDVIGGIGYAFTADTEILLTTAGAAITGTIATEIYYSMA